MGDKWSSKRAAHLFHFRHSHGGIGCGLAYKPFLASRAVCFNPSSTVSPGAYFRYRQHQPSLTSMGLTCVPSSRNTLAKVRLYLSGPWVWITMSLPSVSANAPNRSVRYGVIHSCQRAFAISDAHLTVWPCLASPYSLARQSWR